MIAFDAILPANVRYAEDLNSSEKIFFAEISACTGELGYCQASNSYFSRILKVKERVLAIWLKNLKDGGYIDIKFIKNKRRIYIEKNFKKDFTPLEKNTMKYKNVHEIVNKIKKRFSEEYPAWESTPNPTKSILYTLANFYFDPEAYTKTLGEELISFEFLEMLIEVIDLQRLSAISQKIKNEFGDIDNSTLYIMTSIINNHSKEIFKFRDLQRRNPSKTFEEIVELYHEKTYPNNKIDDYIKELKERRKK